MFRFSKIRTTYDISYDMVCIFLSVWKNADPGIAEVEDARKRLAGLKSQQYKNKKVRKYFRGDDAFAKPEIYEYLEEKGLLYAIRLPANDVLYNEIKHLLIRPVGVLRKNQLCSFMYS